MKEVYCVDGIMHTGNDICCTCKENLKIFPGTCTDEHHINVHVHLEEMMRSERNSKEANVMIDLPNEFSSYEDDYPTMKSFDGHCSLSFIQIEKFVGILLKSPKGVIEIGIGTDKAPFINFQNIESGKPYISISMDEISGQPMLIVKGNDGVQFNVPLDKAIESLRARKLV